jgi:Flp pilus assembly protein TadG
VLSDYRERSVLKRFIHDERGQALILVTVMLPALIGFSLLAIDMARVNNLHNDLQKAADAFALAAAAELDGWADAEDRAERALANLVQNTSRFSNAGTHILSTADSDITWRFLDDLPASDADPITVEYESEDPVDSVFIEVTVTPTGFAAIFPANYLGGANSFNVGATAVAGFAGVVTCDLTPIFICNPFEESEEPLHEIVNDQNFYRRSIRLVEGGSSMGPGNFGFIDASDDPGYGENLLSEDVASGTIDSCVNSQFLHTQTGNLSERVKKAFNTRFDIFAAQGNAFPAKDDARWPPAPNVRKGYKPATTGQPHVCNTEAANDPANFLQMMRDGSFPDGIIGDGQWPYYQYLETNNLESLKDTFINPETGVPYTDDDPPSRYDLYLEEIRLGVQGTTSIGGESGAPVCSPNVGDASRRLIYGAVVNCNAENAAGNLSGRSGTPRAIGYASFFLTEPVTAANEVMAEIVDIDGINGRGTMVNFGRDSVQLYR